MPDSLPIFVDDRWRLRLIEAMRAGAFVITANSRAARWIVARAELQDASASAAKGWATPQAEAFRAFCQRRFAEAQASGLTGLVLLNPAQQRRIWESLCGVSSMAAACLSAWRLLHERSLDLNDPRFGRVDRGEPSDDATQASALFRETALRYRELCRRNAWLDEAMLPGELSRLFADDPQLAPRRAVLYGFEELTPQMRDFAESIRRAGGEVELFVEGGERRLLASAHDDAAAELDAAACWARARLEADPSARLGVVVSDLEQSRAMVERIFLRRLQPEFFLAPTSRRSMEISLGPPLSSYAMIRAALLALRWRRAALSFDEARELLLSPYVLGGLRTLASRSLFMRRAAAASPDPISLAEFLRLCRRRELAPLAEASWAGALQAFAQASAGRLRWREQMLRLDGALAALGWPNDVDPHRGFSSVEHQAWRRWAEGCLSLASLDMVADACSFDEASTALEAACAAPFAPENIGAPVQILGGDEAAGSCFDALWVCGVSEDWPPQAEASSLLPRVMQREAGLAATDAGLAAQLARAVFDRLGASADEVIYSWRRGEQAGELRPSPLLSELPEYVFAAPSAPWAELAPAPCESLVEGPAPLEPGELRRHGVRLLELQSACPFHAFAEARLGIDEAQEACAGLRPQEHGWLIEASLEILWGRLQTSAELHRAAEQGSLPRMIEKSLAEASDKSLRALGGEFADSVRAAELRRAADLIAVWLQVELKRSEFVVEAHQTPLSLEVGGLQLRGRADRVDRLASGGVAILDYKASKNYKAAHWSDAASRPKRLQMPLYALALAEAGRDVEALAYALIDREAMGFNGLAADPLNLAKSSSRARRQSPQENLSEWRAVAERLARDFIEGRADVDPKSPPPNRSGSCRYCPCAPLCRVAEIDFAAAGEEEDDEQE